MTTVAKLRIPIAILELIAWMPASCIGLMFAAAYSVAGNDPPATLKVGLLLVPITFLVCPIYALTSHARK
ncbi:MAG: hypothetical protein ACK53I_05530, partial [Phenylobacterium sp.]